MQTLSSFDCSLKNYHSYQENIKLLSVGDVLDLQILEKDNGFKDVFALLDDKIVGEFFRQESQSLIPFVRYPDKFVIHAVVKKLFPKEDDMSAVILDIEVMADDNFDEEEFLTNYSDQDFFTKKTLPTVDAKTSFKKDPIDITEINKVKRKRNNKIGCLILLIFLGFFIYKCSNTDILADEKARTAKIEKEHCSVEWSKIDKSQKEKVLAEYINVSRFMKNSPDDVAVRLVRESVKYPNTLSDLTPFGEITNVEKGLIEYSGSFTSENKLSMKVKGSYNFKIKYTAGCKPYEYVSFDIN